MRELKFFPLWREVILSEFSLLSDAMDAITRAGSFMACVADQGNRLVGILTDSDIRRALLQGATIHDSVLDWMNRNPVVAPESLDDENLLVLAKSKGVREIPLLDGEGQLSDIFILMMNEKRRPISEPNAIVSETVRHKSIPNPMLILAGGLGSRLRSVVSDRPKPLAIVGDRPILETVIHHAANCGFRRIYISVNYLAEQITEHLKSPTYEGLDIRVIEETQKLGTAGSIGFIQSEIDYPLLVCNADVLTTVPLNQIVYSHLDENADVTCAVRSHRSIVPYGVCQIANGEIKAIVEKPETQLMVNAGIYVLSSEICRWVEKNSHLDMPELIGIAMKRGKSVKPFFLHEYWIDIGRPEDFSKANADYEKHFGVKFSSCVSEAGKEPKEIGPSSSVLERW